MKPGDYALHLGLIYSIVKIQYEKKHEFIIEFITFSTIAALQNYVNRKQPKNCCPKNHLLEFDIENRRSVELWKQCLDQHISSDHLEPLKEFLRTKLYQDFGKAPVVKPVSTGIFSKVEKATENMDDLSTIVRPKVTFLDVDFVA